MNINWVLADGYVPDPTVDLAVLKSCGSFWGGWKTWRASGTDNVICHDATKAQELLQRSFQFSCNLYIPNSVYLQLDRPQGVNLYEGEFIHDTHGHDEIISLHLVSGRSDVVLLLGFDVSQDQLPIDQLERHKVQNYRNLTRQTMVSNSQTQWVLVDHAGEIGKDFDQLQNLTRDTLSNVIGMLAH